MTRGIVTVAGSFAVGLTLRSTRFPAAGETVLAGDFDLGPGGKGSNQAVQVARMGERVELVGMIGTDDFGDIAVDMYSLEGVGTKRLERTSKRNTGVGFIILDAAGENRILLDPGANELFAPSHIQAARDLIADSSVVVTQLEIPIETAAAAMAAAREEGALAVLNPAPAREVEPRALGNVDVLTPNQTEARLLAGLAPDDPTEDLDVCAELMRRGVDTVVLTRGPRGASIVTSAGVEHIDAFPADVVDTTGAGDAFNGTLATALAQGMSLSDAVRRACGAGALACTKLGVIPALPTLTELDSFLA
jgi:ribokinase